MARGKNKRAGALPQVSRRTWTVLAIILFAAVFIGAYLVSRHWAPSRTRYPLQGVSVSAAQGTLSWTAISAQGADFAYIGALEGTERDPLFAANWAAVRQAGLRYGALHRYSLCERGKDQATAFLSNVPRDNAALPPALWLEFADGCGVRPSRDRLLAGLNDYLKQVEAHVGKPALIRVSHDFETHYQIAAGINRTLWLDGDFLPPDYAGRPWVMWTANGRRRLEGVDTPIEWDVVRNEQPDA